MPSDLKIEITYHPDGAKPVRFTDYDGQPDIVVPGLHCPTCDELFALVSEQGAVVALASKSRIQEAMADCELGLSVQAPDGVLRVRLPRPTEERDGWSGRAECVRCRSHHGRLNVRVSTLFGLEEDRAVLHGRCRVY